MKIIFNRKEISKWYNGETVIPKAYYNENNVYPNVEDIVTVYPIISGLTMSSTDFTVRMDNTDVTAKITGQEGDYYTWAVYGMVNEPHTMEGFASDNTNLITCSLLTSGISSIGDYAFQNCTSLESMVIPESVTSIGEYAFQNCCRTVFHINNSTPPTITETSLLETYGLICVPKGSLNTYKASIWGRLKGYKCFVEEGEEYLINITATTTGGRAQFGYVSDDYTEFIQDFIYNGGYNCFIGQFVSTPYRIGYSYSISDNILDLDLAKLTRLEIVGEKLFTSTSQLKTLILPSSITYINGGCLGRGMNVDWMQINATTPPQLSKSFSHVPSAIYVPDSSVDAYKTATNWSANRDRIYPISEKPTE